MSDPDDAFSAAGAVADALEHAGVPYALGGALAYNLWSIPRATRDVDVNVFVDDAGLPAALTALHAAGVAFDDDQAKKGHADGGFFLGYLGRVRVDVFTPSIPFSWEAARTRVQATLDGRTYWYLSAESTAVFKLLFYRGKDLVDLERMIAAKRTAIDHDSVRASRSFGGR